MNLRPIVFWMPLGVFAVLVGVSLASPAYFLKTVTDLNSWILSVFSNVFAWGALAFVITCCWAFFSPIGRIRIGGADATPLLSRWNWLAITLTTTIAIGILFWATAEPMYHLYAPGGLPIEPGGADAAQFSMRSLYMHWAFTPYAIYTVPGLTFALVYYNLHQPFSLSSPITALTGRTVPRVGAEIIDGFALLSLLFGLAASLGAGIMSISGGIDRLTPLSNGPYLLALVAFTIVASFFISSATGLQRGIRILSDINTKIFLGLVCFVLLAGPTFEIISLGTTAFFGYLVEFMPRSLVIEPFNDQEWVNAWTVFYWANWLAWAPLTAMFLGRISLGYTVREYVLVNFLIPAFFSVIWMAVFGGLALEIEKANPGDLKTVLDSSGPESVLYAVVDHLPFAIPVAILLVAISFLSYVTAADSNTDVLASLSLKDSPQSAPRKHKILIKFIWASTVGIAAWVMVSLSGIDGVKMLSNLGGLPALFIVLFFNITLITLGTWKIKDLRSP